MRIWEFTDTGVRDVLRNPYTFALCSDVSEVPWPAANKLNKETMEQVMRVLQQCMDQGYDYLCVHCGEVFPVLHDDCDNIAGIRKARLDAVTRSICFELWSM